MRSARLLTSAFICLVGAAAATVTARDSTIVPSISSSKSLAKREPGFRDFFPFLRKKVPGVPDPTYGGDKKKELYSKYLKCLAGYLKNDRSQRNMDYDLYEQFCETLSRGFDVEDSPATAPEELGARREESTEAKKRRFLEEPSMDEVIQAMQTLYKTDASPVLSGDRSRSRNWQLNVPLMPSAKDVQDFGRGLWGSMKDSIKPGPSTGPGRSRVVRPKPL